MNFLLSFIALNSEISKVSARQYRDDSDTCSSDSALFDCNQPRRPYPNICPPPNYGPPVPTPSEGEVIQSLKKIKTLVGSIDSVFARITNATFAQLEREMNRILQNSITATDEEVTELFDDLEATLIATVSDGMETLKTTLPNAVPVATIKTSLAANTTALQTSFQTYYDGLDQSDAAALKLAMSNSTTGLVATVNGLFTTMNAANAAVLAVPPTSYINAANLIINATKGGIDAEVKSDFADFSEALQELLGGNSSTVSAEILELILKTEKAFTKAVTDAIGAIIKMISFLLVSCIEKLTAMMSLGRGSGNYPQPPLFSDALAPNPMIY